MRDESEATENNLNKTVHGICLNAIMRSGYSKLFLFL